MLVIAVATILAAAVNAAYLTGCEAFTIKL
jgi:hypothetical protein